MPLAFKISKTLGWTIAQNFNAHSMGVYEISMQNNEADDKIHIFSRGAYTTRALAGVINEVDLLPTCNHQQMPYENKVYTCTTPLG
ncbi:uncharacterized protein PHACADRAFT_203193 [Phanerochaete carnosa HHB-10118-sp]|uniref:T6SS Phospholipase effector Tle1-like catalytic domain-containing protein n=1 Tax=Phanerochaete carnosa (strain HHB-10118-sp) TaxID=650164 RepID=K5WD80_PHACS|nr:uncharacterized protein PHACADRAFT_203193 [Phanerochaete carnosa HHB-10118-sp]EKM48137.1 hypothetical protein PHACADRAFT_203193 [Phanerochaete carnosa HHB-10118-sp]